MSSITANEVPGLEREFTGYHGNESRKVDLACRHRYYHISKGNDHWLGNGTYFFEDTPKGNGFKHAEFWCERKLKPAILKSVIRVQEDYLLDLQDEHIRDTVNTLKEETIEAMLGKLEENLDNMGNYVDGIFFNMWDEFFEDQPIHVIRRADFYPTRNDKRLKIKSRTPNVTVLCVRKKECIVDNQKVSLS